MELTPTAEPPLMTEVRIPNKLLVTTKKTKTCKVLFLREISYKCCLFVFAFLVELFGQCKHFRISIRNSLLFFFNGLFSAGALWPKMSGIPEGFSFDRNMEVCFSVPPHRTKVKHSRWQPSDSGSVSWSHVKAGGSQWGG